MSDSEGKFKIKLATGRILGPLTIDQVKKLIQKKHISGTEMARSYPKGEWLEFGKVGPLAILLVETVQEQLTPNEDGQGSPDSTGILSQTQLLPGARKRDAGTAGQTIPLGGEIPETPPEPIPSAPAIPQEPSLAGTSELQENSQQVEEDSDHTSVMTLEEKAELEKPAFKPQEDFPSSEEEEGTQAKSYDVMPEELKSRQFVAEDRNVSQEKTVVFQRSFQDRLPGGESSAGKASRMGPKDLVRATLIALAFGVAGYDYFFNDEPQKKALQPLFIRPTMPIPAQTPSPEKSAEAFTKAIPLYLEDNVAAYVQSAALLKKSLELDPNNIKSLALLASTYLNLIDSCSKDENYFNVILKLIEASRSKNIELPETVISNVEFYITINKAEAAQNAIVEYTKTHPKYGIEMFYYLGLAFFHRGDLQSAARYLAQISDNKAFSPKVFYLRGKIAETWDDFDTAEKEYIKALDMKPQHAKSRLRLVALLAKKGKIKDAQPHILRLIKEPQLLSPIDLASAYHFLGAYYENTTKLDLATAAYEKATLYDASNHDYQLELYTLRAKAGRSIKDFQKEARMYFFLGEGEKYFKENKYQDALSQYLQARIANDKSYEPLLKLGELYTKMNDVASARDSYRKAAEMAKNKIEIWSKYINTLIRSYEWDEAQSAMDRFRQLPVSQSAIDKAAADMLSRQGRHVEAQMLYQKAMSRDEIDPDVYLAYANSLLETGAAKQAPFFYSIALRFDPLNFDAIYGTAKCIARTDGIEQAIGMLQDTLKKTTSLRAELLTAIAEFQVQRGEFDQAQATINQAFAANSDYAQPWKVQAAIYLDKQGSDKKAVLKALEAYQSFSDRSPSDPSGYIERYRIFESRKQFDRAERELDQVWTLYPKYPNLHLKRGKLKMAQANEKEAVREFDLELKSNPNNPEARIEKGKALLAMKRNEEALGEFQKAMQIRPTDPEAKFQAGIANFWMNNFAGAAALFQAALALDKGNGAIYKMMGEAYLAMGDRLSAGAAFKRYVELDPDATDANRYRNFR